MTLNPIHKVLSLLRSCGVRFLLMGGQACILYGAAEFSRDTDIVILAAPLNLKRLRRALLELQAERIAVPPLSLEYLRKGHAIHFRCHLPGAENMRLDIMARLRNALPFNILWKRRTTVAVDGEGRYDLVSLPDLVRIKKTQRDKDWLMLRRLVEAHYFSRPRKPGSHVLDFWLKEMRTPELLIKIVKKYPAKARRAARRRPLLVLAMENNEPGLETALKQEEETERAADRFYWTPLKKELERLRHASTR